MKIPTHIINTYNQKNTLLFVSTYPKKGGIYSSKDVGGTAYTKNKILGIKKYNPTQKIVVLTTCLDPKDDYSYYVEDNVLVIRCFKRGSLLSFIDLFQQAKVFINIPTLFFELEFASYGEIQSILVLPLLFLAFLSIKKRIALVLHQVVMDLATLSGHIGVTDFRLNIFSWGLRLYYRIFGLLVDSIIVLEDQIKERLGKLVDPNKIHVVYHGVDANLGAKKITQSAARKKLGITSDEFVILYYGYVTWYKGADFIANTLKTTYKLGSKKLRVIFAGGEAPTQSHKAHYQKYFTNVASVVKKSQHMTLTGFIEEKDIPTYVSACDLAILPFRTFKSSSGSLATIYAFEKPFIVSEVLQGYFKSQDMVDLFTKLKMNFKDISFSLTKKSLLKTIQKVAQKEKYAQLINLSKHIKKQRDFAVLAPTYLAIHNASKRRFTFSMPRLQLTYGEK